MEILKEWLGLITGMIALVISVSGVLLQYRKARADEKKGDTDVGRALQESALALIKPYREELERLRGEVAKDSGRIESLETEIDGLRKKLDLVIQERNAIWNGAKVLHYQVKCIGVDPMYTPPESVVELGVRLDDKLG